MRTVTAGLSTEDGTAELRRRSAHFGGLWEPGTVGEHTAARKSVGHPGAGAPTLDRDVLGVGGDLRVMVCPTRHRRRRPPGAAFRDGARLLTG
ncbi:hypothetical protein ACFYZN_37240 [Streptomyces sp. NPDC001777]|uniref:MmyB family transcriptional regulator n=1 Tax=Streptomyces sp. NPDC001777 TaxID=3364608 RepID=UPI0036891A77